MKRSGILVCMLVVASAASGIWHWRNAEPKSAVIFQPQVLASSKERGLELLSPGYRLDRIYRSMEGPSSAHPSLSLPRNADSRFVWLTGVDTEVVDGKSLGSISQEFMCHSNLTFDSGSGHPEQHNRFFNDKTHLEWRLFTMVPGRFSIRLPEGFGIPVPANAQFDYYTMSLNQNVTDREVMVRIRSRVHSVPAEDPGAPTKALFRRALYVLQPQTAQVSDNAATQVKMPSHVGAGCADFCMVNASAVSTVGKSGQGQTLHWLVPPGKHTFRTEITEQLNLPFGTTAHYATFHIHPYGKMMQLRDLTTGQTLIELKSKDWTDRIGVSHVDELKSVEGVPLDASHRYELVAEYDNTTPTEIDAMGIIYLYLLEKDFSGVGNG